MMYDIGNPGPGLGQTSKYGVIKLVNWIPSHMDVNKHDRLSNFTLMHKLE